MEQQLQLDLRIKDEVELDSAINELISVTLDDNLIKAETIKNKHEAYGIMAEHLSTINNITKSLKSDVGSLLSILPMQGSGNSDTLNAISAIYSTAVRCTREAAIMSVLCRKITEDIYEAERAESLPLEEYADDTNFEEAEKINEEE